MMETMQLYVKMTSNCPAGLQLSTFELLGPTWTGDVLRMLFGPEGEQRRRRVVGWTDLFGGRPCAVNVARVRALGDRDKATGYMVWGGNSGVRVLDSRAEPIEGVDDHLPPGFGKPIVWVENVNDLPATVRKVVTGGAP